MELFKKINRGYVRTKINIKYAFNIRKPLLILRIIKAYLNILLLSKIPLRYVDVSLSYGCNLRCQHCSAARFSRNNEKMLTTDDYKRIADQCLSLGVITVGFTGGEPTLYPKIEEVIKAFQPKKVMISLITNATLLNAEKVKKFKSLGADILCISLDSYFQEEHDAFRGVNGAYDKTMNTINLSLDAGLKVVIVTTVTHDNIRTESIRKLIEFTKQRNLLLIFSLACPAGRWSKREENILLNDSDIEYMNKLFLEYPHLRRDFESNWLKKGCGAGNEKLYITPYGDIIPCPFIHIAFGNLKELDLKTIRDRLLLIPELRGYPQKCLSGEDIEFSRKYVIKANTSDNVPVYYKEIFSE